MPDLDDLQRKTDYYASGPAWVRNLWSTPAAFDWFIKNNRREFEQRGVIVKLARDWLIDTSTFESAVRARMQRRDELSL